MARGDLDAEGQQEVQRRIGEILTDGLRPGWAKATFRWTALIGAGTLASLAVQDEDGSYRTENIPEGLSKPCGRLKHGMYRPGTGTWHSMEFTVAADGRFSVEFDYDGEIEPPHGFVPEHFRKELTTYPRDPEHIPGWWQEILAKVPNFYAGVHAEPGERYRGEIGPDLGEVGMAFEKAGWEVGPGEYARELRFSTDWAVLETLSHYGLVRMAGRIDPEDWDRLVSFLSEQGWNFGATLYDGDDVLKEVKPRSQD
ncbi:hypothetical protein ACQP1W_43875 [Spirillospora sp. CA-255316]